MSDVYLYGHVSTGIIVRLAGRYPGPDGYGEIVETLENHCGEATGSALVLARLGALCAIEGNWIGDNPECRRTVEFLAERGIDCSGLLVKPGYVGVTEITISDGESRTVFGRYHDLLFTAPQWEPPTVERIERASVVCVDPSFGEATVATARAAKAAGKPLVSSDAPLDSELCSLADYLVISNEMIANHHPEGLESDEGREKLFERYLERCSGLVVFTSGSKPLWYARRGGERRQIVPTPIEIVDPAGAGDSFRGGLIYGVLQGWDDDELMRFSSAVAALVCMSAPGCVNPPTLEQVQAFLDANELKPAAF
jgi:sugar/nucleoside kinase (ribokinase family)